MTINEANLKLFSPKHKLAFSSNQSKNVFISFIDIYGEFSNQTCIFFLDTQFYEIDYSDNEWNPKSRTSNFEILTIKFTYDNRLSINCGLNGNIER